MITEHFIRNSDNQVSLTLTEDGTPISGAWTALDVWIGSVQIHRTQDGDGVALNTSTGVLTLTPGDLTTLEKTALGLLTEGRPHRVEIVVTSDQNDDGAVFGGPGSERLTFIVGTKPE